MPGDAMADAIPGRRDLERRVKGGIAGIGMIAREGVNSLWFTAYRDNVSLAGFAGPLLGDRGGDAGCRKPGVFGFASGMDIAPSIAVRGLPLGDAMGFGVAARIRVHGNNQCLDALRMPGRRVGLPFGGQSYMMLIAALRASG
jgi:hypothetical protein